MGDWAHLGTDAPMLQRQANGAYQVVPQAKSNGAANGKRALPPEAMMKASQADWRADVGAVHVANAKAVVEDWHKQDVQTKVHKIFNDIDGDSDGHLAWNNNEIRNLVSKVFEAEGLPRPNIPEPVFYR